MPNVPETSVTCTDGGRLVRTLFVSECPYPASNDVNSLHPRTGLMRHTKLTFHTHLRFQFRPLVLADPVDDICAPVGPHSKIMRYPNFCCFRSFTSMQPRSPTCYISSCRMRLTEDYSSKQCIA